MAELAQLVRARKTMFKTLVQYSRLDDAVVWVTSIFMR